VGAGAEDGNVIPSNIDDANFKGHYSGAADDEG